MYYSLTQRLGALPESTVLLPRAQLRRRVVDDRRRSAAILLMRFPSLGDFLRMWAAEPPGPRRGAPQALRPDALTAVHCQDLPGDVARAGGANARAAWLQKNAPQRFRSSSRS